MLKGLQTRTVMITGAAGGIGRAACERFLAEGSQVVAVDINVDPLADLVGEQLIAVRADVRSAHDIESAIAAGQTQFGGLDLAFINAGVECRAAPVAGFSEAEYERVFDINVRGAFLTASAMVRHLNDAGREGGILFTASIAALQGSPTTSVYNASKHAVLGIMRCLALETATSGIRVNVLCPGTVDTRMIRSLEESIGAAVGVSAAEMRAQFESTNPVGRHATAEEVAAMAVWILSDEAPFAHGETFTIGGGLMA